MGGALGDHLLRDRPRVRDGRHARDLPAGGERTRGWQQQFHTGRNADAAAVLPGGRGTQQPRSADLGGVRT